MCLAVDFYHRPALILEKALEPEIQQRIERVVATLAVARKYTQFYPPGSSNVTSVLEHLANGLQVLAKGYASTDEDSAPPDPDDPEHRPITPDGLLLSLVRDRFYYGHDLLIPENRPARKYANDLYKLRVKSIHFLPGVSTEELQKFLELTSLSADRIEEEGGFAECLGSAGCNRINVALVKDLSLVDSSALPEGMDVLAYLKAQKEANAGGGEPGDATPLPEGDTEDIWEIRNFFAEVAKGSDQKRHVLMETLTNPAKLAATLNHIHAAESPEEKEGEVSTGLLRETLRTIAGVVGTLPQNDREELLQKMGEAILSTDSMRSVMVENALASSVGRGGMNDALLAQLPDEDVADALCQNVRFHHGTANTISNFLEEFSDDPRRRSAIQHMVSAKLGDEEDSRLREAVRLLETKRQHFEAVPSSGKPKEIPEVDLRERNSIVLSLQLDPRELDALESAVEKEFRTSTPLHAVRTLLEVFMHPALLPIADSTIQSIENLLLENLEEGEYDFVAEMLDFIIEEMPLDAQSPLRLLTRSVLEKAGTEECFNAIVALLRGRESRSPEFKSLLYLVNLLGDEAAELLFKRLEKEQNSSMRLFIVALFAELGDEKVPFLLKKIRNRQWYVVRNVTLILGKIGSRAALDALSGTLHHKDFRVRQEALRAVASIKGSRSEQMLLNRLSDSDPAIRRLAAEWLGSMGAKRALPQFVELIAHQGASLLREPEYAIGVVHAIGMLGGPSELEALKKFTPRRWLFKGQKTKSLLNACEEAIARLEGRP